MNHPSHAPLVATDLEDAASLMVSEGSPVYSSSPRPFVQAKDECCSALLGPLQSTADRHPLVLLLACFAVGVAAGFGAASVWDER